MRPLGVSFLARAQPEDLRDVVANLPIPQQWRASVYPEFRITGWTWLEIFPVAANKGAGSRHAIDLLTFGTPRDVEVIAIGDSAEDIAMFRIAKRSYCPSTAAPEVHRAASRVIPQPGGPQFVAAVSKLLREGAEM